MIDFGEHCPDEKEDDFTFKSEAIVTQIKAFSGKEHPDLRSVTRQLDGLKKSISKLGQEARSFLKNAEGYDPEILDAISALELILQKDYQRPIKGNEERAALALFSAEFFKAHGGIIEPGVNTAYFAYLDDLVDAVDPEPRWDAKQMIVELLSDRFYRDAPHII
jgi:hypothetical protein